MDQAAQVRLERPHAGRRARLDDVAQLVGLALLDQVADRRRGEHHLEGGDSPPFVPARQEHLVEDRQERLRELDPDLALLPGGEDVDDPVDRLGGVVGVERGEDQVARLRQRQHRRDRLEVAHLPHLHDVGVLAQRGAQGAGEVEGVRADLPLHHDRATVAVDVLDRVLDGDDVDRPFAIDPVDHGGQGGRLAGAGRAGHQDQAIRPTDQLGADGRRSERLERGDLVGDEPQGAGERAALEEEVGADARRLAEGEAEVDLAARLELAPAFPRERAGERGRLVREERRRLQRDERAIDARRRWDPRGKEKVRAVPLGDRAQERLEPSVHLAG